MSDIAERVEAVRRRIATAAAKARRRDQDVTLVAVSKTFPASAIRAAADAGVTDFGENRAQELVDKAPDVARDVTWHFVGRLQTNKVRHVVGVASMIHSVDGMHLAETVSRRALLLGREQDVLVEVNLSGETTKSGVAAREAVSLARRVDALDGVSVRGLMTIPALPEDPEDARPAYRSLAQLGAELRVHLPTAAHLSMGMTRDFEVALEEGATIVRVGEAIFGPRDPRR